MKDPDTEIMTYIKIGELNWDRYDYGKGKIIYDKQSQRQIRFALNLREIYDLNEIEYTEEPPITEVLKHLRRPKGDSALIERLEEKII